MKYSVLRGVSGHCDGDNIFKRLMECHSPRRIPSKEKKCKPIKRCVCSKYNKREQLYTVVKTDIVVCVDGCFEAYHTRKITEVM